MNYMNLFYDYPIIKNTVIYAFCPAILISILLLIYLIILKNKFKNNENNNYKKQSAIIRNFIGLILFSVLSVIFVLCIQVFIDKSNNYNLVFDNNIIYYFILGSPVIPIAIALSFLVRLIKVLLKKEKKNPAIENGNEKEVLITTPKITADDELLIKSAQKGVTGNTVLDKIKDNNNDLEQIPSPEELEKISKELETKDGTDIEVI